MPDVRTLAIQAWEDHTEDTLAAGARSAIGVVVGSSVAAQLSLTAVSTLDGVRLVVFTDSHDVHLAGRRIGTDDWEVLLVTDDDGWTYLAGPFATLIELGEWFANNPPDGGPDEWDGSGVNYSTDDEVMYQGDVYVCLQAHTSQPGWNPVDAPSLWALA